MATETVEYLLRVEDKATPALKQAASAADDLADETRKASVSTRELSDTAGDADSALLSLAGAVGVVNPELGALIIALSDGVSLFEQITKNAGGALRIFGPVAIAVGALALAYKHFSDELDIANEKLEASAEAAKKAVEQYDKIRRLRLREAVATGALSPELAVGEFAMLESQAFFAQQLGAARGELNRALIEERAILADPGKLLGGGLAPAQREVEKARVELARVEAAIVSMASTLVTIETSTLPTGIGGTPTGTGGSPAVVEGPSLYRSFFDAALADEQTLMDDAIAAGEAQFAQWEAERKEMLGPSGMFGAFFEGALRDEEVLAGDAAAMSAKADARNRLISRVVANTASLADGTIPGGTWWAAVINFLAQIGDQEYDLNWEKLHETVHDAFVGAIKLHLSMEQLLIGLTDAIVFGIRDAFRLLRDERRVAPTDQQPEAIKRLNEIIENRSFQTGTRFVDKTGLALIHQGEQVVPAGGALPQRAMMGGGGLNVTVNTGPMGLMPGAAEQFVRELNRLLGARGANLSVT